jgi:hypothetical protein
LVEDCVPTKQRAPAPTRKSNRVVSPATRPPPKLLVQAHTLWPRDRGVSSFNGLEEYAAVTVLWPETKSTSREAQPGGWHWE